MSDKKCLIILDEKQGSFGRRVTTQSCQNARSHSSALDSTTQFIARPPEHLGILKLQNIGCTGLFKLHDFHGMYS